MENRIKERRGWHAGAGFKGQPLTVTGDEVRIAEHIEGEHHPAKIHTSKRDLVWFASGAGNSTFCAVTYSDFDSP